MNSLTVSCILTFMALCCRPLLKVTFMVMENLTFALNPFLMLCIRFVSLKTLSHKPCKIMQYLDRYKKVASSVSVLQAEQLFLAGPHLHLR